MSTEMPAAPTFLLAYDGSPAARRAAALLAGYGGASAPSIVALNVQARPVRAWPEGVDMDLLEGALVKEGRKALARLRGGGIDKQVKLGPAAQVIREEAAARTVDAIVMGTRGGGPLRGYALGSVALRVAQSGVAPTLLVKKDSRLPAAFGTSLKVLLATDGSEPCVRAAELLARWKPWLGELDVQMAHVQEPLTVLQSILPPHDDVVAQWSDAEGKAASFPIKEILDANGIENHLHLSAGEPAPEIAALADQEACELIVLGTRGRGAAHHALVGSVAMKVAAIARAPVLLVP
jgi:nucleotide-binding universal stress UspA family protein